MLPVSHRVWLPVCAVLAICFSSLARVGPGVWNADHDGDSQRLCAADAADRPLALPPQEPRAQSPCPAASAPPFSADSPAPVRCTFFCDRLTACPTPACVGLQSWRLII